MLDALLYGGAWAALVAAGLSAASSLVMGGRVHLEVVLLAFSGTLVVYGVDRLRDVERDGAESPQRTAWVQEHRVAMKLVVMAAALLAGAAALQCSRTGWLLCAVALTLGLAHRRLKGYGFLPLLYVSLSWLMVTVGVPAAQLEQPLHVGITAAVVATSVMANLLAAELKSPAQLASRRGRWSLRAARALAALAALGALLSPSPATRLVFIPAALLVALLLHKAGLRWSLLVLDGALAFGAALSLLVAL